MAHALFPWQPDEDEPDDDPREIAWIRVGRRERGALVWAPESIPAEDLPDWEAVFGRWGGGTYTAIGCRAAANGRPGAITARVNDYVMAGAPRPLAAEPPGDAPAPSAPPSSGSDLAARVAAVAGAVAPVLVPLLSYMAEARKSHEAMMLGMLTQARGDSQAAAQAMVQASQSSQATMAQFFAQLSQHAAGAGGGSAIELIRLGAELRDQAGASGDESSDDMLSTFQQILASAASIGEAKVALAHATGAPAPATPTDADNESEAP